MPAAVRTYTLWALGSPPLPAPDRPRGPDRRAKRNGGDDPDKKFTQADVDRDRRRTGSRAIARTARPTRRSRTGRRRRALRRGRQRRPSELEREQKAREQAEKERDEAKEAAERPPGPRRDARRSKIVEAATKAGAIDPDEVHDLLSPAKTSRSSRRATTARRRVEVTIGDDGQVTGVEDAVKAFLGEKKHLVGKARRPDWDGGPVIPRRMSNDLAKLKDPKRSARRSRSSDGADPAKEVRYGPADRTGAQLPKPKLIFRGPDAFGTCSRRAHLPAGRDGRCEHVHHPGRDRPPGVRQPVRQTVMAQLVYRDFEADFRAPSATRSRAQAGRVHVADDYNRTAGITVQNATEGSFTVTLDTLLDVSFAVTAEQLTLDLARSTSSSSCRRRRR
jgi:hypothetical protein